MEPADTLQIPYEILLLRSITQGRAVFHMEFAKYQQVPSSVETEILEKVHGKVS